MHIDWGAWGLSLLLYLILYLVAFLWSGGDYTLGRGLLSDSICHGFGRGAHSFKLVWGFCCFIIFILWSWNLLAFSMRSCKFHFCWDISLSWLQILLRLLCFGVSRFDFQDNLFYMILAAVQRFFWPLVVFHRRLHLRSCLWCHWFSSLRYFNFLLLIRLIWDRCDWFLFKADKIVNSCHVCIQDLASCLDLLLSFLFEDALAAELLTMIWWNSLSRLFLLICFLNKIFLCPFESASPFVTAVFLITIVASPKCRLRREDHLSVDKRVPQNGLLAYNPLSRLCDEGIRHGFPQLSHLRVALTSSAYLPLLQLLQERASDLQIRPPRIDELKCFHHWPVKLLHQVDADDATGATLSSDWVHKNSIVLISCLVDEVLNLVCHLVIFIKEELTIVIQPVERQILDPNRGPLVLQLTASAVHNMGYLIDCQELQILKQFKQESN